MSVLAANGILIQASSDDATYNEVDGLNDISYGPTADMLETTDFKDTSGNHTRMMGLRDGAISVSGDYEASDTAQALMRTQHASGGALWLKVLWDGTNGSKVQCIVENFTIKGGVAGKVEFSASLKFNGAPAAVP